MADAIVRGSGSNDSFTSRPLHDYKTAAACGQQPCTSSKVKKVSKNALLSWLERCAPVKPPRFETLTEQRQTKIVPPRGPKKLHLRRGLSLPGDSVLTGWRLKFDGRNHLVPEDIYLSFFKTRQGSESIQKNLCRSTQLSAANENAEDSSVKAKSLTGFTARPSEKHFRRLNKRRSLGSTRATTSEEKKAGRCCSIIANDNAAQPEKADSCLRAQHLRG